MTGLMPMTFAAYALSFAKSASSTASRTRPMATPRPEFTSRPGLSGYRATSNNSPSVAATAYRKIVFGVA